MDGVVCASRQQLAGYQWLAALRYSKLMGTSVSPACAARSTSKRSLPTSKRRLFEVLHRAVARRGEMVQCARQPCGDSKPASRCQQLPNWSNGRIILHVQSIRHCFAALQGD